VAYMLRCYSYGQHVEILGRPGRGGGGGLPTCGRLPSRGAGVGPGMWRYLSLLATLKAHSSRPISRRAMPCKTGHSIAVRGDDVA